MNYRNHKINLIRIIFIIISLTILSGCASVANYKKAVDTWNGHSAKRLIATWGYPDNMIKSPDDQNVYIYNNSVAGTFYRADCHGQNCKPLSSITNCSTWFKLNDQDIITQVTFRGPGCKYGDKDDLKATD
jgi:uncharacterized lipoprotein